MSYCVVSFAKQLTREVFQKPSPVTILESVFGKKDRSRPLKEAF